MVGVILLTSIFDKCRIISLSYKLSIEQTESQINALACVHVRVNLRQIDKVLTLSLQVRAKKHDILLFLDRIMQDQKKDEAPHLFSDRILQDQKKDDSEAPQSISLNSKSNVHADLVHPLPLPPLSRHDPQSELQDQPAVRSTTSEKQNYVISVKFCVKFTISFP